jgi:hypothetical protein
MSWNDRGFEVDDVMYTHPYSDSSRDTVYVQPMIRLIDDHETASTPQRCWRCVESEERTASEIEDNMVFYGGYLEPMHHWLTGKRDGDVR